MALQKIQFLDGNYLVNSGARINYELPGISTMFEGPPDFERKELQMQRAELSNFVIRRPGQVFGLLEVDLGFRGRPSNVVLVMKKPLDYDIEGTPYYIAGASTRERRNFLDVDTYEIHIAGDEPEQSMYYGYIPDGPAYRFWYIVRENPVDSDDFYFIDGFLGNAVNVQSTISAGLNYQLIDPSILTYTDSGRGYAIRKPKYHMVSGLNLPYLSRGQREEMMRFYNRKGTTEPFWVAMDPENKWDGPAMGMSFGAYRFNSPPNVQHNFRDKFSISMQLREAL